MEVLNILKFNNNKYGNLENRRIPYEKHENHENHRIAIANQHIIENQ